jgi:hypothetical protein
MEKHVTNNVYAARYELRDDGELAGWIDYRCLGDQVALTHAEVRPALRHRGHAKKMTREALADLKLRGLKALPLCPFVVAYAHRHPDEL